MTRWTVAVLALFASATAMLADWTASELYMRRGDSVHVWSALLLNAAIIGIALTLCRKLLPTRRSEQLVQVCAILVVLTLLVQLARAVAGASESTPLFLRVGYAIGALVAGVTVTTRASDETLFKVMQALIVGSVLYVITPPLLHNTVQHSVPWLVRDASVDRIGGSVNVSSAKPKRGVILLLLDELGYEAAMPLAQNLRDAGMNVTYLPLRPVGANTINAVPAMFSGQNFDQARPCGKSTICSGTSYLDFSTIDAVRKDVDVTGLLHPYCEIRGLRSCYQLELPHEYGNAYVSLAAFYARRLGLRLPRRLLPPPDEPEAQALLLRKQMTFIENAQFWTVGGILYAHIGLPHPPGLAGKTTLDADYDANIEESRRILERLRKRLDLAFSDRYAIAITSDHPLRDYWCQSGYYDTAACVVRSAFQSRQIPLILATRSAIDLPPAEKSGGFQALRGLIIRVMEQ